MTMAFFRMRNAAAAAALLTATLASPALHAAEVWTQITAGSDSTILSGTLGSLGVTMTSTVSTVAAAPSINPAYNEYDIWDNDAIVTVGGVPLSPTVYPNSARLYPASAKGNMQFVTTASTTANPITLTFSQPVFNPKVLVYSLDNSFVDFSATTTADGQPANISAATNSSANFTLATRVLGREAYTANFPAEGCSQPSPPSGRGCGVMQFYGYYTQLKLNPQATQGTDGVGFQVGYDPDVAAAAGHSIPTLTHGALAALGLLLATLAARSLRRRPLQG